jgi:UTP--glucose-1-phosphate uridylyltransferase
MTGEPRVGVIAAAGRGERMYPVTAAVPKEAFPLWRIPVVGHIAREFVEAGIRDIIIVAGRHNVELLRSLFTPRPVPAKLAGDPAVLRFQKVLESNVQFLVQNGAYGNGTPLRLAAEDFGFESCVYAFGDDVVVGANATAGLLDTHRATGSSVLGCQPVPESRKSAFGILECEKRNGIRRIRRIVEKPAPGYTISNLASFGRYVVTRPVIQTLGRVQPGKDREIWFADAIKAHIEAGGEPCAFEPVPGVWHTVGDPAGYAAAVQAVAADESRYDKQHSTRDRAKRTLVSCAENF